MKQNQQLVSKRLELCQANQWAGSSSKEQTEDYLENCVLKTESTKNITQEVEKKRKYDGWSQTLRIDELSLQQKENPSTVRSIWWSLCIRKTEDEDEEESEYKRGWTAQERAVVARMEQDMDRTDSIKVDF